MKKLLIIIILGCVILLSMTVLRFGAYKKIKKQLAGDEQKIIQVYKYKQDITGMEKKALKWHNDENMFDEKIPDKMDELGLLKEMTVLAEGAGIADAQLQLGEDIALETSRRKGGASGAEDDSGEKKSAKLSRRIKEIKVAVDINSTYSDLIGFLDRFRQGKRLSNIERLTLSRNEKIIPNISLHLDIKAYFIPPIEKKK